MTTEQMVERKNRVYLRWVEPWPSVGPDGAVTHADVWHTASVEHCIDLARARLHAAHAALQSSQPVPDASEVDLLDEFMAVNWATPVLPGSSEFAVGFTNWVIPHPGTLAPVFCESFEQAMEEWFEGFNIPVRVMDGKREPFGDSCARVTDYFNKKKAP